MFNKVILIIALISFVSCQSEQEKRNDLQKTVYSNILPEFLDEITADNEISGKRIIYEQEKQSDFLKDAIESFLSNKELKHALEAKKLPYFSLVEKLNKIKSDSLNIDYLDSKKTKNNLELISQNGHIREIIKDTAQMFGGFTLSNIAFNDEYSKGLFYCFYECGRKCAGGYFVFISKEKNNWIIEKKLKAISSN